MPGRRVVDGRLVDSEVRAISWRRTTLLVVVVLFLLASNPANEGTTAHILERLCLRNIVAKWTGRRLSKNPHWNRKTTNYFVMSVKEQVSGLQVGAAFTDLKICFFEDPEWGLVCRKLKSLLSHPGVEWWRLPLDQPPVVLHRVIMVLLALSCAAVICRVPMHDDALVSMFVPPPRQNPLVWLIHVYVDSIILLYPIWERLYEITTFQATASPFRIFGSDDALNFYTMIVFLAVTAAGVRLVTGNEHQHGWLVFLVTTVGYWRGTQHQQQDQAIILEDPSRAESDVVLLLGLRLGWFVLINGLAHVGPILLTIMVALFAGATWGDYHYSQQVWQVWTQSWSKMLDDAWNKLVGQTPSYRAHY